MGQSSGLSPRAELDVFSGSPGVSPSHIFIGGGASNRRMRNPYVNAALNVGAALRAAMAMT